MNAIEDRNEPAELESGDKLGFLGIVEIIFVILYGFCLAVVQGVRMLRYGKGSS